MGQGLHGEKGKTFVVEALKVLASVAIPLLIGFIGSIFTAGSVKSWYPGLEKPSFSPPNWLFAPVWTGLFILIGISFYLIWRENGLDAASLSVYFGQLALNLLWSFLFFGLRSPSLAFIDIIALWLLILANIFIFSRKSKAAAALLVPYWLWVSFASILNYAIISLN